MNSPLSLYRILSLTLLWLFTSVSLYATHIIGGEITYSCLGNNQYEIKLTVFRDCYTGVPPFDDPVSIGIFNYKNELVYDLRIPRTTNDTIHQVLMGECEAIPPNVCVHTSVYTDTVELKPILGGYTLSYQRCCRNGSIVNIVDPLNTGASFTIKISEKALLECNSCAKFKSWPPIFICVNEPIMYDHSAIDADGDSIVYKLCTPINGLGDSVMPQPPLNPPYDSVVWKDPPYNLNNLLGGIPLAIDPHTGLLTGTPNTIGQFVVGVCIEEYRKGELISTTNRDFQYNVGLCGKVASGFFVPDVFCDSLTVTFLNESQNANKFFWDFGDPGTTLDVSTLMSPKYKYPQSGTYTVKLIAQLGNAMCTDTFIRTFSVYPNSLFPDYKIKLVECSDSIVMQLTDASKDTISSIISHKYYLRIGGVLIDSSTQLNPKFVYNIAGIWEIDLVVENALGCIKQKRRFISLPKIIEFHFPNDTIIKCLYDTLYINVPVDTPSYAYTWKPGAYLSDSLIANPYTITPVSKAYVLTIKDTKSICMVNRNLYVQVPPLIELLVPDSIVTCNKNISIPIQSNIPDLIINYSEDRHFASVIDTGYSLDLLNLKGIHKYFIKATDPFGCISFDSLIVIGNAIYIDIPKTQLLCPGDSVIINIDYDPLQQLDFNWAVNSELSFPGNLVVAHPIGAGIHSYSFHVKNDKDCEIDGVVEIFVVDTSSAEFVKYQQCAGKKVLFEGLGINKDFYNWQIKVGDSILVFKNSPFIVNFPDTGSYILKAWLPGVDCIDTLVTTIKVAKAIISPEFEIDVTNCIDSTTILLSNSTIGYDPSKFEMHWILSNGTKTEMDSLVLNFNNIIPDLKISLVIDQLNGCIDTISKSIYISFIPDIPNDSITICRGESVLLNDKDLNWLNFYWTPETDFINNTLEKPIVKPTVNTLYTASLSAPAIDSFVCKSSFTVFVNVLNQPDFQQVYDSIICSKNTTLGLLTDTSNTIIWYDKAPFTNPKATGNAWIVSPQRHSKYFALVTSLNGCIDTVEYNVSNLLPNISVDPVLICAGDTSILKITNLIQTDTLTCVWSPEDKVILDPLTGETYISSETDQWLNLTCTNQFGCSVSDSILVNVFEYKPPLIVTATPDTTTSGGSSQLIATLDNGYTYIWTPATTLSATNIYNPIASPIVTTLYKVEIINEDGCRNEAFIKVVIVTCDEPYTFIPNAFSPNGDGINDVFSLRGEFIMDMNMKIFNRWGEKVFQSSNQSIGWDGTLNGEKLGPDVFAYIIEFSCIDGNKYIKKGNVSLIR